MANRYKRAFDRMRDIISFTRLCKYTSDRMTNDWIELTKSDDFNKLTRAEKGYIRGWFECERQRIINTEVEFCYWIDGVQHSTHKGSIFPRVPAVSMQGNICAHYWIGTDKPYTRPDKAL